MKNLFIILLLSILFFSEVIFSQDLQIKKSKILNLGVNENGYLELTSKGSNLLNEPPKLNIRDKKFVENKFQKKDGGMWEKMNSPEGGYIFDVAFHNNNYYALANHLYKSSDDGANWNKLSDYNGYYLYVKNDNEFFMGKGQGGYNLLYSSDAGVNWIEVQVTQGQAFISKIVMDSQNNLYALSTNLTLALFKSTDNGSTWNIIFEGGTDTSIIWVKNLEIVGGDNLLLTSSSHGIYKSTNGGDTWNQANNGLTTTQVYEIFKSAENEIFALTSIGIFKSSNFGDNWLSTSFPSLPVLSMNKTSTNRLIVAAAYPSSWQGLLYKSDDNGTSWQQINSLYTDIRFEKLLVNGEKIIAKTGSGGLFYSTDDGNNWTERNSGIQAVSINDILIYQNYIFLSSENLIYRSSDYGSTWSRVFLPYQFLEFGITSNEEIYVAAFGALYKTTNFGITWDQISTGINNPLFTDVSIDKNDNVWIGGYLCKIYVSTNNGISWVNKSNGINDNYVTELFTKDDRSLFAGTNSDGIYRSTNNGADWQFVFDGWFIMSIVSDLDSNLLSGSNDGFLKSTDNGLNWINKGFSNSYVWSIVVDSNNDYIVSTFRQIYKSIDGGNSWIDISEGLPPEAQFELAIDELNFIYAGTGGDGLYKTINPITSVDDKNVTLKIFSLSQNYPNPFNPTTSIQYTINSLQFVKLGIYDVLGREIATLVNEEKTIGNYEVEFDGSNLSSGIYFYRIQAGNFTATKKLILIR